MAGRNLFESLSKSTASARFPGPCIFISHKKEDKTIARSVAGALMAMSVNVYFDERDIILQQAANQGDDVAIVECIEDGLDKCTHLLGIITQNTQGSWWVPYEIGGATGRKRECAHLVSSDVNALPSFIKLKRLLLDQDDLTKWVAALSGRTHTTVNEVLNFSVSKSVVGSFLPEYRSQAKIRFY